MMLTEPSLRTFLRFLTARRTLIVAPLSRGVMSVFCNVIKPQGLEPFQFSTKISSPSFVVLLPDTPIAGGSHVAEILNRELGKISLSWEGEDVSTTVSVGVAVARAGELDRRTLIGRADAALYRAKREGRDRVCIDPRSLEDHPSLDADERPAVVATGPIAVEAGRRVRG